MFEKRWRLESNAFTFARMTDTQLSQSISLRPATREDEEFLLQVYQSSRGDDLRGLGWDEDRIDGFLEMQYQAQRKFYESDYGDATDEVILSEGKPAGRLIVECGEGDIRCVDLALLPEYRGRGVGTLLLRKLQEQATAANQPLRLQVIRFNRAVRLFERLGFIRISETGTHFQMEWTASAVKS
jgi:ribosomal protein S18 acetylase RimI-like enzyme